MTRKDLFYKGYREILAAMANAYFKPGERVSEYDRVGQYHFFPKMKMAQMSAAIKKFRPLFLNCPKFEYSCAFKDHGCVWLGEGFHHWDVGRYPDSHLSEIANKEIDLFSINDRFVIKTVVDITSYDRSVEVYNRENPNTPPRYELLLNYPAARMLLLDRQTLEVPEDEIREHFFRADSEGQI